MQHDLQQFIDASVAALSHGGSAVVASTIRYLWEYSKGARFKSILFMGHAAAGLLIGNIVFNGLPNTYEYKVSVLWLVGFLAYPLLEAIDAKGVEALDKIGFFVKSKDKTNDKK